MNSNEIVYRLTVADIQNVAESTLNRKLNDIEVATVAERITETVNWYDPIWFAVLDLENRQPAEKSPRR